MRLSLTRTVQRRRHAVAGLLLVAVAVFTGCSSSSTPAPGSCGAPSGPVALAYPAPNATGIPDNFAGVIFATQSGLTSGYQAVVLSAGSSGGARLQFVAPAPSPLPSPLATPAFSNPMYQESASGGLILPAATQIGVYLNNGNSNCTPSFMGSFTTR